MKTRILDQRGQGLTEYIALMLLIVVVSLGAAKTLGSSINKKIKEASNHIRSDISISDNGE